MGRLGEPAGLHLRHLCIPKTDHLFVRLAITQDSGENAQGGRHPVLGRRWRVCPELRRSGRRL